MHFFLRFYLARNLIDCDCHYFKHLVKIAVNHTLNNCVHFRLITLQIKNQISEFDIRINVWILIYYIQEGRVVGCWRGRPYA